MAHIKRIDKRTKQEQQDQLIEAYELCGNVTRACEEVQVPKRTHYNWIKADEAYREKFEDASRIALGILEDEAQRRAVHGWEEPVYYKGELMGHIRRYSDTLLIVLLKANAPEKYKDRLYNEHNGVKDGNAIKIESSNPMTPESVKAIKDALEGNL